VISFDEELSRIILLEEVVATFVDEVVFSLLEDDFGAISLLEDDVAILEELVGNMIAFDEDVVISGITMAIDDDETSIDEISGEAADDCDCGIDFITSEELTTDTGDID